MVPVWDKGTQDGLARQGILCSSLNQDFSIICASRRQDYRTDYVEEYQASPELNITVWKAVIFVFDHVCSGLSEENGNVNGDSQ